jgi:bacillopeptidase F
MKRLILVYLAISLLCSSNLYAASLELSWSPNSDSDLATYSIYKANSSGAYTKGQPLATVGKSVLIYTIPNVVDGNYYFVLTAIDDSGNESDFSNEIYMKVDLTAPAKPTTLKAILKK